MKRALLTGMQETACTTALDAAGLLGVEGFTASKVGQALPVLARLVSLGLANRMDEAQHSP